MTHQERVIANASSLSNLTDTAIGKIDTNILSNGARKMLDTIGASTYSAYVTLQTNATVVDEIEDEDWTFENSSDDGRKLKDLELAEAYFVLYYISLALRRVDIDVFMTEMESWGEGKIDPIDIDKLLKFSDKFLNEGRILARLYSGTEEESDELGINIGGIGVMVI